MTGAHAAAWRLTAIQASWNFERMLGVGFAWAAAPLLAGLRARDPARHREAVARSAEFFNSHPYLAGVALGAAVRAEFDGVPGAQVSRLRTALCGPLGAIGDQLFWAGILPALIGVALVGVALNAAVPALVAVVLLYNAARLVTGWWALRTGLREGTAVSRALASAPLGDAAQRIGKLAGLLVGLGVPLAVNWALTDPSPTRPLLALGLGALGIVAWRVQPRLTGLRLGLATLVITVAAWGATR